MTLPNVDNKFDNTESILFECLCHGNEYAEFIYDKEDRELMVNYISYKSTLWMRIKNIFSSKWCFAEIILDKKDIERLNSFMLRVINEVYSDRFVTTLLDEENKDK